MGSILAVVRLVRPKQWSKNLLVLAAWIFAGKVGDADATRLVIQVFLGMCLASSAVYVFNDLLDAERDRSHPEKRSRPIASGAILPSFAWFLGSALLVGAFLLVVPINKTSTAILVFYLVLQVLYNVWAKHVPILDVFIIAAGFVARAVIGASAIQVTIGAWLLVCTGTLAMMLGYAKRRHELLLQGDGASASRASLGAYNRPALDALVIIFAAQAMISYGVYSIESTTATQHPALIITTPLVIYGLARYLLLVFVREEGGEPADILTRDPHILASIVLFGIAATAAMNGLVLPFLER